jgi:hypothetical protein
MMMGHGTVACSGWASGATLSPYIYTPMLVEKRPDSYAQELYLVHKIW